MPTTYRQLFQGIVAAVAASCFFLLSTPAIRERTEGEKAWKSSPPTPTDTGRSDSVANPLLPASTPYIRTQPVAPFVVLHGPRGIKVIALTFDACSTTQPSRYDERITNILIETGTPATLFLGGRWMEEEPEHAKRLASYAQFELANHTFSHPHLNHIPDESVRHELLRTQQILDSLTGKQATLFRPPFGEYDERVVRIAAECGLKTVQFDLASGDPDPSFTKEKLVRYVTSMARNGSIIVMHVNGRGWHTAEALPAIIAGLRERGFIFATVSEMLAMHAPDADKKEKARE